MNPMVTVNSDPEAGGNTIQPDDGRDEHGRLPEPLDAAHYGVENPDVEVIDIPGMPLSQRAGTGAVVSSPADEPDEGDADEFGAMHRDDSAAAQGGPGVDHDISGSPLVEGGVAAPSAPSGDSGESRTSGTMAATPAARRTDDGDSTSATVSPAKKTTAAAPAKKTAPPAADKK